MTQTELSLAAGVPRTTINEVLAGKRTFRKTNVVRLAKFFGVPAEELMAVNGGARCAKLKQA